MLGTLRLTLVTVGAITLASTFACSVDHRHLNAGQRAGGTSSSGGANEDGESGAPGKSMSGGEAGATGASGEGCLADLNIDRIPDCKQTVLKNGSFTSDVKNWTPDSDTTLAWDEQNALEDAPSGSAKVESVAANAIASQCTAVKEMQLVIAYGQALVLKAAGSAADSSAELKVSMFDNDDCSGEPIGYFETPTSAKVGQWVVVQAGAVSPAGTKSAAMALVGLKAVNADKVTAYFDNVMLETQALQ